MAAPIGAGLYAMSRPPFERFGAFLTAFGFIWFVASLSNAGDELLYSIGRVAGWAGEVVLIYLLLAFPPPVGCRIGSTAGSWMTCVVLVVVFYAPTALMIEQYPVPAPWMGVQRGLSRATRS